MTIDNVDEKLLINYAKLQLQVEGLTNVMNEVKQEIVKQMNKPKTVLDPKENITPPQKK